MRENRAAKAKGPRHRDSATDPELVAKIVCSVLNSMRGPSDNRLMQEIAELGEMIAAARHEIAALTVEDITGKHIPSATDELDAIVAHTAVATEVILESCETLDRLASAVDGEVMAILQQATTRIYEACGFQDITGQRITRVVATLKSIDLKISKLIATFGQGSQTPENPVNNDQSDRDLLNGPQLPGNAMDQSDIDRLLAGFD